MDSEETRKNACARANHVCVCVFRFVSIDFSCISCFSILNHSSYRNRHRQIMQRAGWIHPCAHILMPIFIHICKPSKRNIAEQSRTDSREEWERVFVCFYVFVSVMVRFSFSVWSKTPGWWCWCCWCWCCCYCFILFFMCFVFRTVRSLQKCCSLFFGVLPKRFPRANWYARCFSKWQRARER